MSKKITGDVTGLVNDPRYAALPWEKKQVALQRFAEENPSPQAPIVSEFEKLKHFSQDGTPQSRKFNADLYEGRKDWYGKISSGVDPVVADQEFTERYNKAKLDYDGSLKARQEDLSLAAQLVDTEAQTRNSFGNILKWGLTGGLGSETQDELNAATESQAKLVEDLRSRGYSDEDLVTLKDDLAVASNAKGNPAAADSQGRIGINDGLLVKDINLVRESIEKLSAPSIEKKRALAGLEQRRKAVVEGLFDPMAATGEVTFETDANGLKVNPSINPMAEFSSIAAVIPNMILKAAGLENDLDKRAAAQLGSNAQGFGVVFSYEQKEKAVKEFLDTREGWLDRGRIGLTAGLVTDSANMVLTPLEMLGVKTAKDITGQLDLQRRAAGAFDANAQISGGAKFFELAARILPQVVLTRKVGKAAFSSATATGAAEATARRTAQLFATGFGGYQSATFNARDVLDNGGSVGQALEAGMKGFATTFLLANGFNAIGAGGVESFRSKAAAAADTAKAQLRSRLSSIAASSPRAAGAVKGGLGEGVEEFLDEFINGLTTQDFTGATAEQLADNAFHAALIGGGFGAGFGAASARPAAPITADSTAEEIAALADARMRELSSATAPAAEAESKIAARISDLRQKADSEENIEQPDGTFVKSGGLTQEEITELESLEKQLFDGTPPAPSAPSVPPASPTPRSANPAAPRSLTTGIGSRLRRPTPPVAYTPPAVRNFEYVAMNDIGGVEFGNVEATDEADARRKLEDRGLLPTEIVDKSPIAEPAADEDAVEEEVTGATSRSAVADPNAPRSITTDVGNSLRTRTAEPPVEQQPAAATSRSAVADPNAPRSITTDVGNSLRTRTAEPPVEQQPAAATPDFDKRYRDLYNRNRDLISSAKKSKGYGASGVPERFFGYGKSVDIEKLRSWIGGKEDALVNYASKNNVDPNVEDARQEEINLAQELLDLAEEEEAAFQQEMERSLAINPVELDPAEQSLLIELSGIGHKNVKARAAAINAAIESGTIPELSGVSKAKLNSSQIKLIDFVLANEKFLKNASVPAVDTAIVEDAPEVAAPLEEDGDLEDARDAAFELMDSVEADAIELDIAKKNDISRRISNATTPLELQRITEELVSSGLEKLPDTDADLDNDPYLVDKFLKSATRAQKAEFNLRFAAGEDMTDIVMDMLNPESIPIMTDEAIEELIARPPDEIDDSDILDDEDGGFLSDMDEDTGERARSLMEMAWMQTPRSDVPRSMGLPSPSVTVEQQQQQQQQPAAATSRSAVADPSSPRSITTGVGSSLRTRTVEPPAEPQPATPIAQPAKKRSAFDPWKPRSITTKTGSSFRDRAPASPPTNEQVEESLDTLLEDTLTEEEKVNAAEELGEESWNDSARRKLVVAFSDWLVNKATHLSGRVVDIFNGLLKAIAISSTVAFASISMLNAPGHTSEQIDMSRVVTETRAMTEETAVTPPVTAAPARVERASPAPAPVVAQEAPRPAQSPTVEEPLNPIDEVAIRVEARPVAVNLNGVDTSAATVVMAQWVMNNDDSLGMPFAIADKVDGSVTFFSPDGNLLATTPALFGSTYGDIYSDKQLNKDKSSKSSSDMITPAGRFEAKTGKSKDYGKSIKFFKEGKRVIAIHKTYIGKPSQRRQERLRTQDPNDNRVSMGCVNIPADMMKDFGVLFEGGGVVYILPETEIGRATFRGFEGDSQPPPMTSSSGDAEAVESIRRAARQRRKKKQKSTTTASPEIDLDQADAEQVNENDEVIKQEIEAALAKETPTPETGRRGLITIPKLLSRSIADSIAAKLTGAQNTFIPGLGKALQYLSLGITKQLHNDIVGEFFEKPVLSWLYGKEAARARGKFIAKQFVDYFGDELRVDRENRLVSVTAKNPASSLYPSDVIENVQEHGRRDYNVSDNFLRMVAEWTNVRNRILNDAREEGINLNFLKDEDGNYDNSKILENFYFPRGTVQLNEEPVARGNVGQRLAGAVKRLTGQAEVAGGSAAGTRPRSKVKSFHTTRRIASEQDGVTGIDSTTGEKMDKTYRYTDTPEKRIENFITDVYSRIEDRRLATHPDIVKASGRSKFTTDASGKKVKTQSLGTATLSLAGKTYSIDNPNVAKLNSIIEGQSQNPDEPLARIAATFQIARAAKFTLDFSAASIQLAYLWGYSPARGAKATALAFASTLGNKSWLVNYNRKNQSLVAERVALGGMYAMSTADVDFLNETDTTSSSIRRLLSTAVSPFTNFHTVITEIGVNEMYAALRYQATDSEGNLDPIKAEKIVRFADRSAGRESLTRNGLRASTRSLLSTVSSAPGMYSAFVNLMADTLSSDKFTRNQALKAHSRFIVGSSMLFLAKAMASMLLDDEDKRSAEDKFMDALSRLNPKSKKFFSTEVSLGGGRRTVISEGGFFRGAIAVSAKVLTDPGNAGEHIGKYLKGKKSPGIGTALEMISGKDYFGNEITTLEALADAFQPITLNTLVAQYQGSTLDVVAKVLNATTPFEWKGQSLTRLIEEKPHLSQTLEQMVFSAAGFSAYTESSRGKFNRDIDNIAGQKFGSKYRGLTYEQKVDVIRTADSKGITKPVIKFMTSYQQFANDKLDRELKDPDARKLLADRGLYQKMAAIPRYSVDAGDVKIPIDSEDHKAMYDGFRKKFEEFAKTPDAQKLSDEDILFEAELGWENQLREKGY
jgi:hypothetical protein